MSKYSIGSGCGARSCNERAKTARWSSFGRCESGGAVIEFAICITAFMMFVAGIISFGLYIGVAHSVQQLAADSARASVAGLSDSERSSLATSHVDSFKHNYPLLVANKVYVSAGSDEADQRQFNVILSYDATDLPIWIFTGLIPLPPKTIVRTASIKNGGF